MMTFAHTSRPINPSKTVSIARGKLRLTSSDDLVTRVLDKSRSRVVRYLLAARLSLGNIVHESRRRTWDIAC